MNSLVLLKVPADAVKAAAPSAPVTSLDGGSLVVTKVPFDLEPDELAYELRQVLGAVLDQHGPQESRGIFVIPDVAKPGAGSYAAALDEAGELGFWVPTPKADMAKPAPRPEPADDEDAHEGEVLTGAPPPSTQAGSPMPGNPFAALGGGFPGMGGMPGMPGGLGNMDMGALMSQMSELLSAMPPDFMSAVSGAMQTGDMSGLEKARGQMEQAMSGRGGMAALQQQMEQMLAAQGISVDDLMEMQAQMEQQPGGSEAMMAQAEAEIERMRREDPAQLAELEKKLGVKLPSGGKR